MITFPPLLNPLAAPFTLSLPSSLFHITSLRSELLLNRGRAHEGEAFCNWECHVQCILVTGLRGQKWFSVVVWWKVSCQTRAKSNPPLHHHHPSKEYCLHPPGFKPPRTHTANGSRQALAIGSPAVFFILRCSTSVSLSLLGSSFWKSQCLRIFNTAHLFPNSLVPFFPPHFIFRVPL